MSEYVVFILECIGTIAFAITGVFVAVEAKLDFFGVCFVGCTTAVGGGMLRDVLTKNIPFVLRKHIYALASLVGTLAFYFLRGCIGNLTISSTIGVLIIVAIRLLASKFRWSLPKIHIPDEE